MNENIDLSQATLDDIVFENRNKSYGAYLLRKLYDKNVLLSLGIAIILFSLALAMPVIIKKLMPEEEVAIVEDIPSEVTIIDVPIEPLKQEPVPIPKMEPPKIKTVKFVPPEPAPDNEVTEPPPPPQDNLDKANISNEDREGEDVEADLPPDVPVGTGIVDAEEGVWMGAVSKYPAYPGGAKAMQEFINARLSQKARSYISDRDVHGTIYVFFIVAKDGTISEVKIPPGKELANCKICNEEAIRLVMEMPKWQPAENNGVPVKLNMRVPIRF